MNGLTSGIFHLLVFGTQIKCVSIFTQWVSHLNVLGHCKFVQTDTLVWRRTAAPNLTNICSFSFWQKNTFQVLMNWKENNITLKKTDIWRKTKAVHFFASKKIVRNWEKYSRACVAGEEGGYWAWAEREGGRRSEQHQQAVPHSLPPFLPSLIPLQALLFLYLSCRNLFPHPPLANTNTQNHEN